MRAGAIDATPVVGDGGTVPSVEHSRSAVSCLAVQVGISPEANQILVPAELHDDRFGPCYAHVYFLFCEHAHV